MTTLKLIKNEDVHKSPLLRWTQDQTGIAGILDFPLIAQVNSAKNLGQPIEGRNIYFGTGVVTSKVISQGLPFDFLGMLLTAEWIRRKTGADGIIHEISDSHALATSDHSESAIHKVAQTQKELITQFTEALGLDGYYRCVLASEYRHKKAFEEIQHEVNRLSSPETSPYFRFQSAGNLYFARHESVGCKIGWVLEDNEKPPGLDERRFNDSYDSLKLHPICFIYTGAGRNFDEKRTRVAPYTAAYGEKRLMLSSDRSAHEELLGLMSTCQNTKVCQSVVTHLARIVMSYDILFGLQNLNFWAPTAGAESSQYIKMKKQEPWMLGQYINLKALADSIDEIRSQGARTYDADLLQAVRGYISASN